MTPEFLVFGTFYEPDFITKTSVRSYFQDGDEIDITKVVHDGVASICVATDEALTMGGLDNLSITTLEVAADVTGTEASPPVPLSDAYQGLLSGAAVPLAKRPRFREAFSLIG